MPLAKPSPCRGFTLIELSIVMLIMVIMARTAILSVSPMEAVSVDRAAEETVDALRFARAEAARIAMPTSVTIDAATATISVHKVDFKTSPPVSTLVLHPLTKMPYSMQMEQRNLSAAAIRLESMFAFADGTTSPTIGFLPDGTPGKLTLSDTVVHLANRYQWRGSWQPVMDYAKDDIVVRNDGDYVATQGHKSGLDFQADLAVARWAKNNDRAPQIRIISRDHRRGVHVAPISGLARVQP